ncbi:MAG: exonuclease domain-containing protein [Bacteroidota bacterium]|nr:exonuclease domain-containing protein [Bacteroidota bacterium]MDP3146100.1 exonuclease domain-containing protein [Bacteroidota bacterium]
MFAIIDIETCGGKFNYQKGRITEICIIVHDGLVVVDKYTTLINPECYISPYFTNITSITNDMVRDAPKFHEVAKKIIEMTANCVFVAHNVGFDYNFVKEEFASLGYKYHRETLCTVRLSRKLIPGRISYSLGHLCASLGIEIFGRHRAEGDAVATAQLFDLLMSLKNSNPLYKNKGVVELMTRRIDNIKKYILDKLPESCGVYYFLNKEGQIIYIGKSVNMYTRAQSHFGTDERKGKKMLNDLYNVDFVETGSELIALLFEAEEIKKHKPLYNRKSKADVFTHSIDWFTNKEGIIHFKIVPYEEAENSLVAFTNYSSTRERLESWIDEKILCLQYCSLTSEGSFCFNHQIKKCNGICAGEEGVNEYNKRAQEILDQYTFHKSDFAIIERGRKPEENSLILIENGHYVGFGYFDVSDNFSSKEEIAGLIKRSLYYPDMDGIVQAWLRKSKRRVIDL